LKSCSGSLTQTLASTALNSNSPITSHWVI